MATFTGTVTGGSLNLRSSTSTSSTALASIPNGTSLSVSTISGSPEWFSTSYSGYTGYVVARYIAFSSGGQAGTVTTESGSLNIRATPSASGTISFTLSKGTSLRVLDTSSYSGWYRIGCSSGSGWASSTYITLSGGSSSGGSSLTAGHYVEVSSNYYSVNVRASTSTSSSLRGVLLSSTKMYCSSIPSSSWVQIIWGGMSSSSAYILSQYLVDGGVAPSSKMDRAIAIGLSMADDGYPYDGKIGNLDLKSDQWCVQYLSWLMKAAGCSSYPSFTTQATVSGAIGFFGSRFGTVANGRTPKTGDWVMYSKGTETYQHVGLIVDASGKNITTVEGNLSNTIKKVGPYNYLNGVNSMTVYGFATPSWI